MNGFQIEQIGDMVLGLHGTQSTTCDPKIVVYLFSRERLALQLATVICESAGEPFVMDGRVQNHGGSFSPVIHVLDVESELEVEGQPAFEMVRGKPWLYGVRGEDGTVTKIRF